MRLAEKLVWKGLKIMNNICIFFRKRDGRIKYILFKCRLIAGNKITCSLLYEKVEEIICVEETCLLTSVTLRKPTTLIQAWQLF
jgi:hypothetical protein